MAGTGGHIGTWPAGIGIAHKPGEADDGALMKRGHADARLAKSMGGNVLGVMEATQKGCEGDRGRNGSTSRLRVAVVVRGRAALDIEVDAVRDAAAETAGSWFARHVRI